MAEGAGEFPAGGFRRAGAERRVGGERAEVGEQVAEASAVEGGEHGGAGLAGLAAVPGGEFGEDPFAVAARREVAGVAEQAFAEHFGVAGAAEAPAEQPQLVLDVGVVAGQVAAVGAQDAAQAAGGDPHLVDGVGPVGADLGFELGEPRDQGAQACGEDVPRAAVDPVRHVRHVLPCCPG